MKWTKRKHQNEWKWIEIAQNEWNYQNRDKPVVQNEANEPKWIIKMNENGLKSLKNDWKLTKIEANRPKWIIKRNWNEQRLSKIVT